jgi:hypothetical protein
MVMEDFIGIYENAYSPEYCQRAIRHFELLAETGATQDRLQAEGLHKLNKDDEMLFMLGESGISMSASRQLSSEFFTPFWAKYYEDYSYKYSSLRESGTHKCYAYNMQKIRVGGGYHMWHYESMAREVANRVLVFMLYLNDVQDGGETEFLYQHKRVQPKQGTLVIWPAGFTHTHRGNPPLSNDKYIMTGWLEF